MPRARNIKPAFFKDAKIVACSFPARLLFEGLWCLADYKGRLKYVPLEIKMELFPADSVSIEELMGELLSTGLIEKYTDHSGATLVQVTNFERHQNPHVNEKVGKDKKPLPCLPGPEECEKEQEKNAQAEAPAIQGLEDATRVLLEHYQSDRADSLNLIPDSLLLSLKELCASGDAPAQEQESIPPVDPPQKTKCRFDEFWAVYPKRRDRKKARDAWKRKKLDSIADVLINDVKNRIVNDGQWLKGYIPLATTYFNGERWNDELEQPTEQNQKQHDNRNGGGSALDKVLAGINATAQGHHAETLGDDGSTVRPQVGEQLRGGSGPDGSMGSIFEGDFTRHD